LERQAARVKLATVHKQPKSDRGRAHESDEMSDIIVGKWTMSIKGTYRQTGTLLVEEHGGGQKHVFFTCWISQR
jgi:hypothetical protein